jgi:hypothetical protein
MHLFIVRDMGKNLFGGIRHFFIFYLQLWKEESIEWPGKSSQEKCVGDKEC